MDSVTADLFKAAMRRFAAGVTIVAAAVDGERLGLTATAVCSLSAEPPQLLVCVHRAAEAHGLIARAGHMGVSLLATSHHELSARFAGQTGISGPARFEHGHWTALRTGAPLLADAVAAFDCVLAEQVEASTHTIFIGRVVAVAARDAEPLTYADGTYGTHRALR